MEATLFGRANEPTTVAADVRAQHSHGRLAFDGGGHLRPSDERATSRLSDWSAAGSQPSAASSPAGNEHINWNLPLKYVNLNLVRNMIAQHTAELIVLCVIIIYLAYYFTRISKRPKLVGSNESKFVKLIRDNFQDPLGSRFNPLIYFWGTNPQTALFGYLQGQTSDDEVPRNKFKRQHLFVSDAQYLATNVDLSQHYEQLDMAATQKVEPATSSTTPALQPKRGRTNHRLVHHQQLDAGQLLVSCQAQLASNEHQTSSILSQNIRLAVGNQIELMAAKAAAEAALKRKESGIVTGDEEEELEHRRQAQKASQRAAPQRTRSAAVEGHAASLLKSLSRTASSDSSGCSAMGSSSDSGVFETGATSSSSCSSSSHSGSSLTIDIESTDKQQQQQQQMNHSLRNLHQHAKQHPACACTAPYELELQSFDNHQENLKQPFEDATSFLKFSAIREQQREQIKREQLEFGQCALDWYLESHQHFHQNNQVALISAGMTTGSDKKYVTDTVQTLHKLGYEVCVFIRRGVGGLKLSSTKFFSPSKWRDFEAAILSIKKQRPGARLVAIGFSFGSIELCRYLSMSGAQSLVDSALLVSCPFDPEAGGRNMRKRVLNRKIDAYLAKNLGKQLYQALAEGAGANADRNGISLTSHPDDLGANLNGSGRELKDSCKQVHINYNGSLVDLSSLPKIKSLVDFEDNYNRVIQNYPSSDAYADDSRLSELLMNIRTPTLCLSSEDDFMAPLKLLPIKQIEANKNLCMILTKRGGHMAFIDGILWPKRPYFAQRIIEKYMKLDMTTSGNATTFLTTTASSPTTATTTVGSPAPNNVTSMRRALFDSLSTGKGSAMAELESRFHLCQEQRHQHPQYPQNRRHPHQHHHHHHHHQRQHQQKQQQHHRYYSIAACFDDS